MAKNESYEYRHINNPRRFKSLMFQRFRDLSTEEIHNMWDGINNDAELGDVNKEDLLNFVQTNLLRRYKNIHLETMDNDSLQELKNQIQNETILKTDAKQELLKAISTQRNENSRIANEEKLKTQKEQEELQEKRNLEEKEKQAKQQQQLDNENRNRERRQAREDFANKTPQELTDKELVELYAKENYAYNKFLEASNKTTPEVLANRDRRRAIIKGLKEEIDKRGISTKLSEEVSFSKREKHDIEAAYLSGKNFRNFTVEQWTNEESLINQKISELNEKLKKCFDQDKANRLQNEIAKCKYQLEVCHRFGEKAMDKQIGIDKQKSDEQIRILEEEAAARMQEEENILQAEREKAKIEEEEQVRILFEEEARREEEKQRILKEQADKVKAEQARKLAEEAARVEQARKNRAEFASNISKEVREKEREAEKIIEAEERRKEEQEKTLWGRFKLAMARIGQAISKNWKKIVAPILGVLAIGGGTKMLTDGYKDTEVDKSKTSMSEPVVNPKPMTFGERINEQYPSVPQNNEKNENIVPKSKPLDLKLGTVIRVDENLEYTADSLGGGNSSIIGVNPNRQAGEYIIDGVSVVKDGEIKDFKYGVDPEFNVGDYILVNTQNGEEIQFHISQGTEVVEKNGKFVGSKPTGWTKADPIVEKISKEKQREDDERDK